MQAAEYCNPSKKKKKNKFIQLILRDKKTISAKDVFERKLISAPVL